MPPKAFHWMSKANKESANEALLMRRRKLFFGLLSRRRTRSRGGCLGLDCPCTAPTSDRARQWPVGALQAQSEVSVRRASWPIAPPARRAPSQTAVCPPQDHACPG